MTVTRATARRRRRAVRRRQAAVVTVACTALVILAITSLSSAGSPTRPRQVHPTTTKAATGRPMREQAGWTAVTIRNGVILADRRTFVLRDGNVITVFRFRAGRVRYALHAGSADPPGVAAHVGADGAPEISRTEARVIVAAFNGGFKVASDGGGFELGGRVYVPLLRGGAALEIDATGAAHVGVWGAGLPVRGVRVVSVRQNLQPLVMRGRLSSAINDLAAWGSTLGGVAAPARSAVGQDAHGNLIYAASMQALPVDLGVAMVESGAVFAMELDINPYWVQLAITPHTGGRMVAGVPNQERPSNQFLVGWTRDFFTVMTRP
jgi:hypothetical protein